MGTSSESTAALLPPVSLAVAANVAVLVDFDNAFLRGLSTGPEMANGVNQMLRHALEICPLASFVDLRLYGGWLQDGILTAGASAIQSAIGASAPVFPFTHPYQPGLLRGRLQLVTRLELVPGLEWRHTLRSRRGLPRVTLAESPYPAGCVHESAACPVKALQQFARRPARECNAPGCGVTNHAAFRVPEQKMVDVMLTCDAFGLSSEGWAVIVLSSDMDVLPAVAMIAARAPRSVALIRSIRDSAGLYEQELSQLDVPLSDWTTP